MLIALAALSALIVVWSAWLVRARVVPGWVRLVSPLVVTTTIVTAALTFWLMHRAVGDVSLANPAERQHVLADGIATAMSAIMVGCITAVLGAAILGWFTLRAKRAD